MSSFFLELYLAKKDMEILPELEAFWYDETIRGASTFHLQVSTSYWQKWSGIVTGSDPQDARLRWGSKVGTSGVWSNWKSVLLYPTRFQHVAGLMTFWVDGVDAGYRLNESVSNQVFVKDRKSVV